MLRSTPVPDDRIRASNGSVKTPDRVSSRGSRAIARDETVPDSETPRAEVSAVLKS